MDRPNIVFIIADQHRWDFWGKGDNGVTLTPNLDRLADRGTVFDLAYCTAPLCSPSRAAIASGRYGMNSGCFTNLHELPPGSPTFVSQLRAAGYHTAAVGKTHMEIHAYDSDLTSTRHQAFMDSLGWEDICETSANGMMQTGIRCAYSEFLKDRGRFKDVIEYYRFWGYFMDKEKKGHNPFMSHEWPFDEDLQEAAFVANQALRRLRDRNRDRPFFMHVGFPGPHSPTEPLPAFMDLYRSRPETPAWGEAERSRDWLDDARRGYRAMISQIDHHVGRVYDLLADEGTLDNTVFIYGADHGEMAGDHGRLGKVCFYEGSIHVPLVIAGPGVKPNRRSGAMVEMLDLGKTICDLCSVEPHALDQGLSLAPILGGEDRPHRDTLYAEMGCDRMLRDERYKLMWGSPHRDTRRLGRLHLDKPVNIPPSPCALYDLQEDPRELHDLAGEEEHRETLQRMRDKLLRRQNLNMQTQPNKSRGEYRPVVV